MSNHRRVLEASALAHQQGENAVLAVVVDTEGSTYVRPGAMALFGASQGQVGWLSGGCLEPEIENRARSAGAQGRIEWMDIDTREDEDLIGGSALGCRGRLRLALLPLALMPSWDAVVQGWRQGRSPLQLRIAQDGQVSAQAASSQHEWRLDSDAGADAQRWQVEAPIPPSVLLLGAGPETPMLVPLLRDLGWMTTLVERRARWRIEAALADEWRDDVPDAALKVLPPGHFDAALVMHHNFEMDREALYALAATDLPFIGLLGPARRREDLFRVLPAQVHESLSTRLHSPIGLKLGGQGAEAIALSIAAQLQAHRFGERGGT